MRHKLLCSLTVGIGIGLFLVIATAQWPARANTSRPFPDIEWVNSEISGPHKRPHLDYTPTITFTPVATIHLPVVLKNYDPLLVYFDDFSNPGSGWYVGEWPGEIKWSYQSGEYEIYLYKTWWWGGATAPVSGPTNYSVEADMRCYLGVTTCGYGLIFGLVDWDHFYVFSVDPGYQEYSVWRYAAPNWVELIDWTSSSNIKSYGATNRLMVIRNGSYIAVYVNGHLLATANDGTYTGNGIGLFAESYEGAPVAVRFDNVRIRRLTATASMNEILWQIRGKWAETGSGSNKER